jgi:negative regulator of replication initiation
MAIIDNDELPGNELPVEEPQVETTEVKTEEAEIPDKYRGKSMVDIVKMHQEAEKLIGKHAQEVGEVRKLADELLKQQLSANQSKPAPEEEPEIDFFADPKKAVERAVEKHPAVVKAQKAAEELERTQRTQALRQRHPDMPEIVQSKEFADYVKASERRVRLFQQADTQYDTEAADELLTSFKELRALKTTQTQKDAEVIRKQTLKDVSVDSGGTSGESVRKVYRRADLIRLKMTDPDRYDAMSDEIMKAYSEGRVK